MAAIGLGDYGRAGDFFARQIARWSRQYQEDDLAGRDPNMDRLLAWLPEHMPPDDGAVAVVHGDFRADNVVFAPDAPEVRAVLDWELSTLGHPMGDFTYHLMMYRLPPHDRRLRRRRPEGTRHPDPGRLPGLLLRTGRARPAHARGPALLHGLQHVPAGGHLPRHQGRIARGTASSVHAQTMADNLPELAALAWAQTETTS